MTIHLGRPLPDASRDRPGRRCGNASVGGLPARRAAPIWSCSRWGLPCRPRCRRRGALLPHPFTLASIRFRHRSAVCFLWHCPWGRPRRVLPGTVFPWSPDFPPPANVSKWRKAAIRPSGSPNLGRKPPRGKMHQTSSMRALWPGAAARRRSRVRSGASSSSAKAT